jgi:hypothetical protein
MLINLLVRASTWVADGGQNQTEIAMDGPAAEGEGGIQRQERIRIAMDRMVGGGRGRVGAISLYFITQIFIKKARWRGQWWVMICWLGLFCWTGSHAIINN